MAHVWVKYTATPIDVLEDEEGRPIVVDAMNDGVDPLRESFGCKNCHEPLETHYGQPCKYVET